MLGQSILSVHGWGLLGVFDLIDAGNLIGGEAVDLLVHFSISNIGLLVVLLVMLLLRESTLECGWVGAVWFERQHASHSGVEWWSVITGEGVDLLHHSSFGDVFVMLLVVVMFSSLGERWLSSFILFPNRVWTHIVP